MNSEGAYDADLETVFLSPLESITLEHGRSTRFYDRGDEKAGMMDYVRAVADARDGFLTVLYPKEKGANKLDIIHEAGGSVSLVTDGCHVRLNVPTKSEKEERTISHPLPLSVRLKKMS
ncbi:hypothetical protein [Paenibacillus maysiensis]|uniref:hypothetical protein n=1 Tax=Paenibacillus maysiensis TaxID=1155954 RepID=UPI000472D3BF|nr:hypothetical protein [Paenibacillus maysiensis]